MRILLLAFGLSLPYGIQAAPFCSSDYYPDDPLPTPTLCGVYIDSKEKIEVPITKDASGVFCKIDISGVAVGAHSMKLTHIVNDPVWGMLESPASASINFTKPSAPIKPVNITLIPK